MSTIQNSFRGHRNQAIAGWPETMRERTALKTARASNLSKLTFDPARESK